jgi:hypothetical protein
MEERLEKKHIQTDGREKILSNAPAQILLPTNAGNPSRGSSFEVQ